MATISDADKVLKAATSVSECGKKPFSGPDLVAATWEAYPHDFGLPGKDKSHPDTCKVFVNITGRSGLLAAGFLRVDDNKKYTVTDKGMNYAADLFDDASLATGLTSKQNHLLIRLLASEAVKKVEAGHKDLVWKSDVESFYALTSGASIDKEIESVMSELCIVESKLEEIRCVEIKGKRIDASTVRLLKNIGDLILGLHEKYLDKLRKGL
jgi:hypothetical protein